MGEILTLDADTAPDGRIVAYFSGLHDNIQA
jgi:hypothetical protein